LFLYCSKILDLVISNHSTNSRKGFLMKFVHSLLLLFFFSASPLSGAVKGSIDAIPHPSLQGEGLSKSHVYHLLIPENVNLQMREQAEKIKTLLRERGFSLSEDRDEADYFVFLSCNAEEKESVVTKMMRVPSMTKHHSKSVKTDDKEIVHAQSKTSVWETIFYPSTEISYQRHISIDVVTAKEYLETEFLNDALIWSAIITSNGETENFRKIVDYLLVAGVENFGKDTRGKKRFRVSRKNRLLRKLR